ncbi:hypothetical protein B6U93_03865 [Candidatus Woesearchaeota archaeon ex4484_78]|nr:MAG: hypothetical protein B6U93_03865 [Candidatus Woesearchaeota archaeon ex4484_78]
MKEEQKKEQKQDKTEKTPIKIKDIEPEQPTLNTSTKKFIAITSIIMLAILLTILLWPKNTTPKTETITYNNFEFQKIGNLWKTTVQVGPQQYELILRYNPKQVENVSVKGKAARFKEPPIYITFNPEEEQDNMKYLALAGAELSQSITRALGKEVKPACTQNTTYYCHNISIVKCGEENKSVIYITAKEPTQIQLTENCITLQGKGMDLLRSVDLLLYRYYGIIQKK